MIVHPITPIFNKKSKILILGSFPSVKSRQQLFFYGHPQNRFWKVVATVFESEMPKTIDDKKTFLLNNGIALWDVIASCDITGSSDSSIKKPKPNDIALILKTTNIKSIFTNGKTAQKYYDALIKPVVNREAICLPSTSPANALWSFERLVNEWSVIKK